MEVEQKGPAAASSSEIGVLSEEEFLPWLRENLRPFVQGRFLAQGISGRPHQAKAALSSLAERATDLSEFLDEFQARSNRTYAPLTEYVGCVRGFAIMGWLLTHLVTRLGTSYPLVTGEGERFSAECQQTLIFVEHSLSALLQEALTEAERLVGPLPYGDDAPEVQDTEGATQRQRQRLPSNLADITVPEEKRRIAEIASKFLAHKRILDRDSRYTTWSDPEEMRRFVLDVSDEQQVRFFTTRIHNVVSSYDTFIRNTRIEREDADLPRFRARVGVVWNLLQVMTELVHFYERHENDIRCEQTKHRIADLVDKGVVLDRILNGCLFFVHVYMEDAAPIADEIAERYMSRTEVVCRIPEGVDLHGRPVSLITRVVQNYGMPVEIEVGGSKAFAGSMLEVLMAVGAHPETRDVTFRGDRKPLEDLQLLFENGLGEKGRGSLPLELAYLRI